AALAGVTCGLDLVEQPGVAAHLLGEEIQIADEHGKQVVEVVSDPGREAAERLHPRAAREQRTDLLLVVDVDEYADETPRFGLAGRAQIAAQRDRPAVGPGQTQ